MLSMLFTKQDKYERECVMLTGALRAIINILFYENFDSIFMGN